MTNDYSSWKQISLKRDSVCAHCGTNMPTGAQALWSRAKSQVACLKHLNSNYNASTINDNKVMNTILKAKQEDLVIPTVTGIAGIGVEQVAV